ncbi:DUF4232 domain-containing protein [Streptomyces sp. NPDC046821]|uniref:DUF4232 domain-containing protein n=1 Tax=Streptomyces sp. NPDC046821 TaxID=3154702 RepID=UPI0033EDF76C
MRIHKSAAIAVVAVAAGLSLTACNSDGATSGSASGGASASASAAAGTNGGATGGSAQAQAGGSGSGSGGGSAQAADGSGSICHASDLSGVRASSVTTGGAEVLTTVRLTNNGSSSCSMHGFPGVDLNFQGGGSDSAARSDTSAVSVTLSPGQSTTFQLMTPYNNSGGTGVNVTSLTVTPPNDTHQLTVRQPQINLAVTDGSDSSAKDIQVGPIGGKVD